MISSTHHPAYQGFIDNSHSLACKLVDQACFPLAFSLKAQIINNEVLIMDKRTEYVERLSAHMVEWDSQIDLIKDKAESAAPETKFEYSNAIAALQFKRDEVAAKLQGISSARDDEWEELKTGTEHVLGEVRSIFHNVIMMII
jgi:hypothetical protein